MLLSGQEALCCVKLSHSPYARHTNYAVLDCNLAYEGVLLEEGYQDFVREEEEKHGLEHHDECVDQSRHVEVLAALPAHLCPEDVRFVGQQRAPKGMRNHSLQCSVDSLSDPKAQSYNYIAQPNAFYNSLRILKSFKSVIAS